MNIPLPDGTQALIDDLDAPLAARHRWRRNRPSERSGYVFTKVWDETANRQRTVYLHRLVMRALPGQYVDHVNGNCLDCWRANLRLCSNAENQQNTAPRGGSSRYKGVSFFRRYGKWRVMFNWRGKTHFVGYFDDEAAAARAYDAAVHPLAGAFARLNFPE